MSNTIPLPESLTSDQEKALLAEAKTGPFRHTTPSYGNDMQSGETPRLSSKRHAGSTPPTAPAPAVPEVEQLVRDIHRAIKRGKDTQDHGLIGNLRCILDHVIPDPESAAPAVREPLTTDRIAELWADILLTTPPNGIHEEEGFPWARLARAVEQEHDIGITGAGNE